jgi:hypothetical protein
MLWLSSSAGRWKRVLAVLLFCVVAAVGPVFWFRYNQYFFKDWLAFARGPYSARQIYLNALQHGGHPYPGDHNLFLAVLYYFGTLRVNCGYALLLMGEVGVIGYLLWLFRRRIPVGQELETRLEQQRSGFRVVPLLLWLPLPWYIWAMWSGNVPIFIPQFWPHGYYNVRYGVQLLPAIAAFSGLFIVWLSDRVFRTTRITLQRRWPVRLLVVLVILVPLSYALMFRGLGPITYAEAVYNSPDRLAMEGKLATALKGYRHGDRLLMFLGTYPGALADDDISIREVIHEGNYGLWDPALAQPQSYVKWVVVEEGTITDQRVNHEALARFYQQVAEFSAPYEKPVRVYRLRTD